MGRLYVRKDNLMEEKKRIVGLDIGTTKIVCFVGEKNEHGKIDILSMGKSESLGVVKGVVQNIQRTIESISTAVSRAQEKMEDDFIISDVYVGIAGQHIKSLQHRGVITRENNDDEVSQEDVNKLEESMYKLVMEPGQEIITVLPQEYIVDKHHGIKDPIGVPGARLEANCHVICGDVQAVRNIRKCVEKASLKIEGIFLEPIASSESVLSPEEKEAGVVLVDIGGGTTDVAIFYDGIIRHTAVIPFGGNIITDDIKKGCKIMNSNAEKLKVNFGSACAGETKTNVVICIPGIKGIPSKEIKQSTLAAIIEARMTDIIELVDFEIKNSGYENKLGAGIVVTGGGSQLKHLKQLFEYKTAQDARIGLPTEHLANSSEIDVYSSPIFSTGIGLVLKGFESNEMINQGSSKKITCDTGDGEDKKVITDVGDGRGGFFSTIFKGVNDFFDIED